MTTKPTSEGNYILCLPNDQNLLVYVGKRKKGFQVVFGDEHVAMCKINQEATWKTTDEFDKGE